ncbi:MAG: hypothetical protein EBR85_06115 [Betaproteobacteria bacterium]|nr:hypothetical protein [Betaproteobacteria bacterium]
MNQASALSRQLTKLLCGLAIAGLAGCAIKTPPRPAAPERFSLERPDEQLKVSRSGRFILSARLQTSEQARGGQGRFEWLQLVSPTSPAVDRNERQILIWLGPLGQTLGSIERRLVERQAGLVLKEKKVDEHLHVFDADGRLLGARQQSSLAQMLLGESALGMGEAEIQALMRSVMISIESMANITSGSREFQFRVQQLDITLRAVLDPT